jgi:hypothetical protein
MTQRLANPGHISSYSATPLNLPKTMMLLHAFVRRHATLYVGTLVSESFPSFFADDPLAWVIHSCHANCAWTLLPPLVL